MTEVFSQLNSMAVTDRHITVKNLDSNLGYLEQDLGRLHALIRES